jgi:hypothetical protein
MQKFKILAKHGRNNWKGDLRNNGYLEGHPETSPPFSTPLLRGKTWGGLSLPHSGVGPNKI